MHKSIINLSIIKDHIKSKFEKIDNLKIIAVSKTFSELDIKPLIDYGHTHFGENKIQEAVNKWTKIKNSNSDIKLHMIGKLQTNKTKLAVSLFDYIHSLDNLKLAEKISSEQLKLKKKVKVFIQVNIGKESQKNGINADNLNEFYRKCVEDFDLNIVGLMCIPPHSDNIKIYFEQMAQLNKDLSLTELSMGMSSDYLEAIKYGSTYVRIGSKIFGSRAK